jgi:hypothetical protein
MTQIIATLTWVTDSTSGPVVMVMAEPSASLAGALNGCCPGCARRHPSRTPNPERLGSPWSGLAATP